MSDDRFFDRVRQDARKLRYEANDAVRTRLAARVRARIEQPTVSEFLAAWFRPLAATLSALALVASIGLTLFERGEAPAVTGDTVEVSMGGDVYSVAE
ncbi:MAG TPA: hypothetical protein VGK04_10595 [Thermoanaerobaculia bacterium]